MAEVLVCAADRPVKDSAGRWYRGMPVISRPDGHRWGKEEGPPKFFILKLPNLSVEDADLLLCQEWEEEDEVAGTRTHHGRRKRILKTGLLRAMERSTHGIGTASARSADDLTALVARFSPRVSPSVGKL